MKHRPMLKYIISFSLCFMVMSITAQENKKIQQEQDSVKTYKTAYGIRVGVDISKPIKSFIDNSYSGFEVVGDYRLTRNWYAAAELGYEKETSSEDFLNATSKGSYIRVGANYNSYQNWLDMNNEIYLGFRYGFSIFDQTLNSYTHNVNNTYFPVNTITTPQTATGLTAHWTEVQLGIKVETFKNLFIGVSAAYKIMLSIDDPANYKTLFAPGFNRVFQSNTGFGFNYTISYTIPIVNK